MSSLSRSAIGIALLVLLAGCGSAVGPTDAGGDGTTTTTLEYPAGTNETGIVDQTTLVNTHQAVLSNQSYALTATQRVGEGEQTVHIRSNPQQKRAVAIGSGVAQLSGTELFITETAAYVKRGSGESVQYTVQEPEVPFPAQHRRQIGPGYVVGVLDAGQYEPVGQTTVDGVPVWEFELVEYGGSEVLPANATNTSATVMIDGDGVVRVANISVTTGSQATTIEIDYRVTKVGSVTVAEPDWLSEAKAQTNGTA